MTLAIAKIFRAWLSVDGVAIEAFANPKSVKVSEETVTFVFRSGSGEINAVAMGRAFEIEKDKKIMLVLEAKPRSRRASVLGEKGWVIEDTGGTSAWIPAEKEGDKPVGLEVVSWGEAAESDQLCIDEKGNIEVAPNLVGKTIKIRAFVTYPRYVAILNAPLEQVTAHIVGRWEDDTIRYAEFKGVPASGQFSKESKIRTCQISVREMRVEELC